jgi:diguanylate cyclase (GGDEF)-like protein
MSIAVVEVLRRQLPARRGFPAEARAYLASLALAAVAATAIASATHSRGWAWSDFVILLVVAAGVQLFAAHTPANQVFHAGLAFTVSAVLLLPPQLAVVVCVVQHLPEWARQRYPWFIQTFNIVNYVLSALGAWLVWRTVAAGPLTDPAAGRSVAAAFGAGAVFVVVNHALLARMLKLARGRSVVESGLFGADALITDGVLACIGIGFAFALPNEPALALVAALPIALIHRALVAPGLREQALKDHKTGLLNARGIENGAEEELARATRFRRPVSLLLCDVDDLRSTNNRYGHLAGDAALAAVAESFCSELRDYDLCGRFGGDEFVIVLPETELAEALEIATRIDQAVARRSVSSPRGRFDVRVSIGAAACEGGATLSELIAQADSAMYDVKRTRRERVNA